MALRNEGMGKIKLAKKTQTPPKAQYARIRPETASAGGARRLHVWGGLARGGREER